MAVAGSFVVFQKPSPATMPGNVFTLAWMARATHPGTSVTFQWDTGYSFVWSETGALVPGINFNASQVTPADLDRMNCVQLTVDSYGASYFTAPDGSGAPGSLTIKQLASVVPDRTSVGIGMSGSGTCAIQAAPNLTAVFTPAPNYWVAFGNYQTGEVLDLEDAVGAVEVTYGGSRTSRTAVLGLDNLITVS
jgi:hypothetical protein